MQGLYRFRDTFRKYDAQLWDSDMKISWEKVVRRLGGTP